MIKKKPGETNTEYVRRLVKVGVYPNSIERAKRLEKNMELIKEKGK